MDDLMSVKTVLRVERGQATDEELAAVAVTLLSLLSEAETRQKQDVARRLGKGQSWLRDRMPVYRAPHSWH